MASDPSLAPPADDGFAIFFSQTYEVLLRAIYLITSDRFEAEDLAQDTFVRAYERWGRIRVLENPAGYLFRMALNTYRSRLRRLATSARKAISGANADPIAGVDDRDEVRSLLASLPKGQREAIVLVEWLGMTSDEAAQVLGSSGGAVRVQVHRARQTLRSQLERTVT